ncbi:H+-transporting ATPase [Methanofollis sp. W23]|uniref:plasma-membrane proton-efflux P-type ATPase n=1 Tax=Methanofollis sp. W23 TaxID=2817849 RepID=UPI001AE18250|nr:plasma-membrane proton-efflux P-type ATPase [Methanofollis sp. W23]MBP2144767.1 H+-transporting ATPase [Methanofollis sp. W23]
MGRGNVADIADDEARSASVEELQRRLSTRPEGLTTEEAARRLERTGYNEIPEHEVGPLRRFLAYFWGPIPWMIEAAIVLSALLGRLDDLLVILVLLLVNAGIGFWQEGRADNAIRLLKQKLALKARVLRDSDWMNVPARELVPGDMIRLRLGDIVPADAKIAGQGYLVVDESALTGESLPVTKKRGEVAYAGTVIRQGETEGLVFATGLKSFFGRTTGLVGEEVPPSHFQKAVIKIGDYLIALAVALAAVILIVALFRHESPAETLQFALVLTVAAIPAALPAVLTTTLAVGAMALARREAIVSRLVSIEEMAGVDILCVDKTGTLTRNELTVAEVVGLEEFSEDEVLLLARLASREEDNDPIDNAVIARFRDTGGKRDAAAVRVTEYIPFNPVDKRAMATLEAEDGTQFMAAKGAPQAILALVGGGGVDVEGPVAAFAGRGYRTLGVARADATGEWRYAGLIALYDPPRDDSAETIKEAKAMGLQIKLLTGDHIAIAREIAAKLNLGTRIAGASTLTEVKEKERGQMIEDSDGFAGVYPEHKYEIVAALQEGGHIVGMTGDGVNDAPALKKADAGIAVAGATDAAKSAADIVLTLPGISVIIDAVTESRKTFQRMSHYAIYRIAETIRVVFFITASIIAFNFYPVTALMIVLLALLNDFAIMTIAFDRVVVPSGPVRWDMRTLLGISTILGIYGVFESFGLLYLGKEVLMLDPEVLRSFVYLKLSVAGHLAVFAARTRGPFWSVPPAAPLFLAVVVTQAVATLITVYGILMPPMGWGLAAVVWVYALAGFFLLDFIKLRAYSLLEHTGIVFNR